MHKYAFFIALFFTAATVQAQQQNNCTKGNPSCSGNNVCVLAWQGIAPNDKTPGTCMTPADADAEEERRAEYLRNGGSPPPSFNNENKENTKENDIAPTCPAGKILVKGTCITDPCGGTVAPTITPNPVRSWQSFMARYISQPIIQPQQARPAAAGPTTNSFGARAGIVEGDDICKWENSPEENEFNACTESLRPKNQFPNWPAIYAKCKELHRAACGSDPICIKGAATYPAPGKMNCQSKKLSGSVFDALWGFVTHRKPY